MPQRDDATSLADIFGAARLAVSFVSGMDGQTIRKSPGVRLPG